MNGKFLLRLSGGIAVVALGTTLMAMSGMARGLENGALESTLPATHAEGAILLAQADPAPAMPPAAYTQAQADRGKKSYEKYCVECHGDDLKGGLIGGPPLRGLAFEEKYANGAPAGALFDFITNLMPPDNPGRYSKKVYADIMAYILKQNGIKEGAELPADSDTLYTLAITK
jgi:mono/diheme cytochrome c family protein